MMELRHLNVHKPDGTELISDISFTINPGDRIAIIGEEGNGKSTLLRILLDPAGGSDYFTVTGEILHDDVITGYLPQHLPAEWFDAIPADFLLKNTPDQILQPEDYNRLTLFHELADSLHLPTAFLTQDLPMAKLSGGERVKLQLLKLMGTPAGLLLLDEPTNDLDLATLIFLEEFILRQKMPVVFVSHDETLLERCANRILHLEQVNLKTKRRFTDYRGTYRTYVEERLQGYEKTLQLARKEKAEYLEKKRRLNDIMNAVHHAQNAISRQDPAGGRLLKKKMHAVKSMERRFEKESYTKVDHPEEAIDVFFPPTDLPPAKRILEWNQATLELPQRTLLVPFDLTILARDKVVFTGNNGTGKSLLLAKIYEDLTRRGDLNIGYMPQDYMKGLEGFPTGLDFLAPSGHKLDKERARELMGAMKFTREEMLRPPAELSDGQKAKLFILHFIKEGKQLLILDEPTRNFSPLSAPVIREILSDFTGCIISASHDRLYIANVCDRQLNLADQYLTELP